MRTALAPIRSLRPSARLTAGLVGVFLSALSGISTGWAQTPPANPAAPAKTSPAAPAAADPKGGTNQRIERISVEDSGSRIDELRVGGETRSITVAPKGGLPAYDVQPSSGTRTWKIFGF